MAGSFDSHFARHNMMWQCQLSQPDCRCYRVDGYSLLKRLPLHPLIGPRCPLQSVGQWLDSIGLVQYENHLLANGFDNVQFMVSVFSSVFFFFFERDLDAQSLWFLSPSCSCSCFCLCIGFCLLLFHASNVISPFVTPPSKLSLLPKVQLIISHHFLSSD